MPKACGLAWPALMTGVVGLLRNFGLKTGTTQPVYKMAAMGHAGPGPYIHRACCVTHRWTANDILVNLLAHLYENKLPMDREHRLKLVCK